MKLIRTAKIKLKISPAELLATFEACTKAFNLVCQIGYRDKDFNSVSLHHKTYHEVREILGLPSDMACQMRMKSAEALKPAIRKNRKCPQSQLVSIRYSHRGYTINFDQQILSLLTLNGRIRIGFFFPAQFQQFSSWRRKSAELILRGKTVYFCLVFEKDVEDITFPEIPFILGIDRGINKLAVCSDNTFYNGNIIKVAHRYQHLRRNLQKCGTPSAKRHLHRISGKENRFRKDVNHCISKKIVSSVPKGSIVVLEDLKSIRQTTRLNKKGRRKLHSWSFYQFEALLKYKAEARGIKVDYIDSRYTSQKCSRCGSISKANRKYQSSFKCNHCGFSLNADLNAARNIELNYRDANGYPEGLSVAATKVAAAFVNQPIVAFVDAEGGSPQLRRRAVTSRRL